MKKDNRKKVTTRMAMVLSIGLLLAGCNKAPTAPVNDILRDAMKKSTSILSHTYEMTATGNFANGQDNKKLSFNGNVSGGIDLQNTAEPKFTMKLVGSALNDAAKSDAAFELRFDKTAVYINLSSFNMDGVDPSAKVMLDGFKAKWWKIALPAEALQSLTANLPSGDDSKLTPDQKKMRDLALKTDFFDNLTYVDTQDVKGENSYHLKGTLSKTNLKTFLTEVAKIQGQADDSQAEMMKQLDESLNKISLDAEFWVGQNSGVLTKFLGHFTVNDTATKTGGQADFAITMADFNKPITVEVPKDAVDFPIGNFLPGFSADTQSGTEEIK